MYLPDFSLVSLVAVCSLLLLLLLVALVDTDLLISVILCSNADEDQWRQTERGDKALPSAQMHTHIDLQCARGSSLH